MHLSRFYQVVTLLGKVWTKPKKNIAEAIELHVESMIEEGEEVPIEMEPILVTRLSVPIAA